MKIEDNDYLVFASGKRIYVDCGVVGLSAEGELTEGYSDQLLTHELNDHEKWELARFMIDRWMDFRDKLWSEHEDLIEGLGKMVDRTDDSPFPIVAAKLGGPESRPNLQEMIEKDKKEHPCKDGECGCKVQSEEDEPTLQEMLTESLYKDDKVVDVDGPFRCRCIEKPFQPEPKCSVSDCPYNMEDRTCSIKSAHVLREGCVDYKEYKEGEIPEIPKCITTTCFEYDANYKDGCSRKSSERDRCGIWKALIAKEASPHYYSFRAAMYLLNEEVPCPKCKCDTCMGMVEKGADKWIIVEPRYCHACGWKEESWWGS